MHTMEKFGQIFISDKATTSFQKICGDKDLEVCRKKLHKRLVNWVITSLVSKDMQKFGTFTQDYIIYADVCFEEGFVVVLDIYRGE